MWLAMEVEVEVEVSPRAPPPLWPCAAPRPTPLTTGPDINNWATLPTICPSIEKQSNQ